jgi:hypothetical protein
MMKMLPLTTALVPSSIARLPVFSDTCASEKIAQPDDKEDQRFRRCFCY